MCVKHTGRQRGGYNERGVKAGKIVMQSEVAGEVKKESAGRRRRRDGQQRKGRGVVVSLRNSS